MTLTSYPCIMGGADWIIHKSKEGVDFYYNTVTKQSTWIRPLELGGTINYPWSVQYTSDGRIFYYNDMTKLSQWDKPDNWKDEDTDISIPPDPQSVKNLVDEAKVEIKDQIDEKLQEINGASSRNLNDTVEESNPPLEENVQNLPGDKIISLGMANKKKKQYQYNRKRKTPKFNNRTTSILEITKRHTSTDEVIMFKKLNRITWLNEDMDIKDLELLMSKIIQSLDLNPIICRSVLMKYLTQLKIENETKKRLKVSINRSKIRSLLSKTINVTHMSEWDTVYTLIKNIDTIDESIKSDDCLLLDVYMNYVQQLREQHIDELSLKKKNFQLYCAKARLSYAVKLNRLTQMGQLHCNSDYHKILAITSTWPEYEILKTSIDIPCQKILLYHIASLHSIYKTYESILDWARNTIYPNQSLPEYTILHQDLSNFLSSLDMEIPNHCYIAYYESSIRKDC